MSAGPERMDGSGLAGGGPGLERITTVLRAGGVVGLPTDTVYGLCADPSVPGAMDRVFAIKGRPRDTAVAVLVADTAQAASLTPDLTGPALALVEAHWPGALTVVVGRRGGRVLDLGGDPTRIGIRCPAHPLPRAVAAAAGPVAATSANRHGEPPVVTADLLAEAMPEVDLVVDGGPCTGRASTVVDVGPGGLRVLREGDLALARLLAAWEARRPGPPPPPP